MFMAGSGRPRKAGQYSGRGRLVQVAPRFYAVFRVFPGRAGHL
ncbi:hypothetical protein EDC61_11359 [Sulfuritortus calidifontis]|uniref:Uncharacterized protein n=1 Tax=Sulfuritortus calidifontis TaxID=1914471 RepID=A0A4R3JTR3_9PROT|nr:hypothetical protein EDC61_11359 [Sulfuritortus calidifontis]